MKKFGKLKLFGLLFILIGALIFIGINSLEAKKPVKSEVWKVTIPPIYSDYNLYGIGINNDGIYENVDDIVYVKRYKSRYEGNKVKYVFKLTIYNTWEENCSGVGNSCYPDGDSTPCYTPGQYTVGFKNITFDHSIINEEGKPCCFPLDCSVPVPSNCMKCFLEKFEHPSWFELTCKDGIWKKNGYRYLSLTINIFDDIESLIHSGEDRPVDAGVYLKITTGWLMLPDDIYGLYHDVIGVNSYVASLQALVSREGDTWTITFENQPLEFKETYKELVGEIKPKGKSGLWHYDYDEYTPLVATALFSFQTKWTRVK